MKEQLYSELKNRILSQKYAPGEKLVIDSLARELAVSNTPLREALTMLESDGLVVTSPNSGTRVVTLDDGNLYDINQAIYVLLAGGYDLCRQLGCEKELIALMEKRLAAQMNLLEKNDEIKFIQAAIVFDKSFLDATKNSRLASMYDRQAEVFFLAVARRNRDTNQRKENLDEHETMLAAVKKGKGDDVRKVLASHYHQIS